MAVIGGINLGNLTDYLFVFTNGSVTANWGGETFGYLGDVAFDPTIADEHYSPPVCYSGTIFTNAPTLGAWQGIINDNAAWASGSTNNIGLVSGLATDLANAFAQINALPATPGFESRSSLSLDLLDLTTQPQRKLWVINVTSGLQLTNKFIRITGNADQVVVLRWDADLSTPGYQGEVKFGGGSAIVPQGGLTPSNFINVAGDIDASGGGSTPPPPYPQGLAGLIPCGEDWTKGGGFFTGYWLTTGSPGTGVTGHIGNGRFVGGWYTSTVDFNISSGTSGIYVAPNPATLQTPEITVLKEVSVNGGLTFVDANIEPFPVSQGVAPIYRYTVTNTGDVTLTNVTLTDALDGGIPVPIALPVTTLAPNASTSVTVNGVFAVGQHCNTATATGTFNVETVTATDQSCFIGAEQGACISLTKLISVNGGLTFEDADTPPGATLISPTNPVFRFAVTNCGSTTLNTITLTDPTLGGLITIPTTTLTPGQSFTVDVTGTFAFGQNCNIATVNAIDADGTPVTDDGRVCFTGFSGSAIDLVKLISVDNGATFVDANDIPFPVLVSPTNPIFQFVVTNIGTVPLTNVTLVDTTFGGIPVFPTTLSAGQSVTLILPGAFSQGETCNTAIATGTGDQGNVTATDFACYVGVVQNISVVKLVSVDNGGTFVHTPPNPILTAPNNPLFQFIVTNTGSVTLNNVSAIDTDLGPITLPTTTLVPGQQIVATVPGTFAAGLQCNTVMVTGTTDGGQVVTDNDTACYEGIALVPAIDVVKLVSVDNGGTFVHTPPNPILSAPNNPEYQFVITNIGPVTLDNVTAIDTDLGPIVLPTTMLVPGQQIIVTVPGTFAAGEQCNTVMVSGTAVGGAVATDNDTACYEGIAVGPAIQIIKEVSPDGGVTWLDANTPPGAQIPLTQQPMFRYTVTNIGTVPLEGVSVSDSVLGPISVGGLLQPGQSAVFTATGTWQVGTHCNVATAIGTFDGITVSDTDSACYTGTSVPIFPPLPPPIPQNQIIDYLLETVAFEELALAALVNAEAEKIQAVAAAGVMGPVEPDTLESINRSVSDVINQAARKEELLLQKLARILAHKERT